MVLPIYSQSSHDLDFSQCSKGLRFERFFNKYSSQYTVEDDAKTEFLKGFKGLCGNAEQLKQYQNNQRKLTQAIKGGYRIFSLDSYFVTGMGNPHPVENGFLWHHTLGVPYLSGAQVKGLVRSLFEQFYNKENKKTLLHEWFGSESKSPKEQSQANQVGGLIFFDAIPINRPELTVEVMTPHMGKWYSDGASITNLNQSEKVPADWHDPNPIPFLAVKKANFLFTIAKRHSNNGIDLDQVFTVLTQSLETLGAGAKTQTGFGYMSRNINAETRFKDEVQKQQQEQQVKEQKRQEEIAFKEEIANYSESTQQFLTEKREKNWNQKGIFINPQNGQNESDANRWLKLLAENPDEQTLDCFKNLMEQLYKGIYDNPDKTKGKRNNLVFKPNAIAIAKKLKTLIESS